MQRDEAQPRELQKTCAGREFALLWALAQLVKVHVLMRVWESLAAAWWVRCFHVTWDFLKNWILSHHVAFRSLKSPLSACQLTLLLLLQNKAHIKCFESWHNTDPPNHIYPMTSDECAVLLLEANHFKTPKHMFYTYFQPFSL